ncbi:MAG: hemolysin family protein [Melioribacteraceae bacterium]|nr:hemolysin family protein [Melioribacteraceae bacterium]
MEFDWSLSLILLVIFLLFSALFSGSEVALFSLDRNKLKNEDEFGGVFRKYLTTLMDSPRRLLVTILIGNTLFNVGASILSVKLSLNFAQHFSLNIDYVLIAQIVLLTILVLFFGEVTPKVWASKYPTKFAKIIAIPLYWFSILIYPVSKIITDSIRTIVGKFNFDKSKTAILSTEISDLVEIGVEKGTIEEEEHDLIHGLVNFKSISAREVMTPRVDITSVSTETTFNDLMKIITDSGHSRIPLFESNLDNIIGILFAKDLLPFLSNQKSETPLDLRKIARPAIFVPETKFISELLHEFQEKNTHLGVVVDEYGGTAGLVSLEDVLEEIVGEIRDEYDMEENEVTKVSEDKYVVLGKLPIDELNELFDANFSDEGDEYDTVGGFIFNHSGSIPERGFSFEYENFSFTVIEIENNRINKVEVSRSESINKKTK